MQSASASCCRNPERTTAAVFAVFAGSYLALTTWYFWADWFRFWHLGKPVVLDGAGWMTRVNICMVTVLSPWRLAMAAATAGLLGLVAYRFARGVAGTRALALFTLWAMLAPQVLWYTEASLDWFGGHSLPSLVGVALILLAGPTWLLIADGDPFEGWGTLDAHRDRVFGAAVGLAWLAFGATEYLDHSYQWRSGGAFLAAVLGVPAAAITLVGLMRQRTWSLVAGAGAALLLAAVPVLLSGTPYAPNGRAMDVFATALGGNGARTLVATAAPPLVVGGLLMPFALAAGALLRRKRQPAA